MMVTVYEGGTIRSVYVPKRRMTTMPKDILSAIQANMSSFSKGQKLIASFILNSYDKAAARR